MDQSNLMSAHKADSFIIASNYWQQFNLYPLHFVHQEIVKVFPSTTISCECSSIVNERSETIYKSALWAIIYFLMIVHALVLSAHRGFFSPISFHHALEIYFLYIQWSHHKGIVSIQAVTKICLMSVHNMFMSDQTFINQLCERSYISLWATKNTLMIVHSLVLSTPRGFFCPISFIMPCKPIFPISSVILCSRKQL